MANGVFYMCKRVPKFLTILPASKNKKISGEKNSIIPNSLKQTLPD